MRLGKLLVGSVLCAVILAAILPASLYSAADLITGQDWQQLYGSGADGQGC
jgi:hypothetical protein